jgi:hypothetical protein
MRRSLAVFLIMEFMSAMLMFRAFILLDISSMSSN